MKTVDVAEDVHEGEPPAGLSRRASGLLVVHEPVATASQGAQARGLIVPGRQ